MTDPYETRPSEQEEHDARPQVSWWAALDLPNARRISPLCSALDIAYRWAVAEAHDDELISVWEHTRVHGQITDEKVWPEDDEGMVRDHLPILTRSLSEKLTDARRRRDLPSTGRRGSGHVEPAKSTMDPLERALTYDEVYDENGNPRFEFGPTGWPTRTQEDAK